MRRYREHPCSFPDLPEGGCRGRDRKGNRVMKKGAEVVG